MAATVRKIGRKFRVVEKDTGGIVTKDGSPVDGGGYNNRPAAISQATAINISQAERKGHK